MHPRMPGAIRSGTAWAFGSGLSCLFLYAVHETRCRGDPRPLCRTRTRRPIGQCHNMPPSRDMAYKCITREKAGPMHRARRFNTPASGACDGTSREAHECAPRAGISGAVRARRESAPLGTALQDGLEAGLILRRRRPPILRVGNGRSVRASPGPAPAGALPNPKMTAQSCCSPRTCARSARPGWRSRCLPHSIL